MNITQREIDIWRVEAKEMIRKMFEQWRKDYLGRRQKDASKPAGQPPAVPNANY